MRKKNELKEMLVSKWLGRIRALNITQKELGEALGIREATISKAIRGRTFEPKDSTVHKIETYLAKLEDRT